MTTSPTDAGVVLVQPDDARHHQDLADQLDDEGMVLNADRVRLAHPHPRGRFYQHGWHSWGAARWIRLDHQPRADDPPPALDPWQAEHQRPGEHQSYWVGAVEAPGGQILLLGALGLGQPQVAGSRAELRGWASRPVDWYLARGEAPTVFAQYAARLSRRLGARRDDPGTVWCTWYSYGPDVSEVQVRDVLGQLHGWPIDVFLVDDGWSKAIGDWSPNDRFPSGMAALASEIRSSARRPGLWLAPFVAHESSTLAQRHPDWLIRDDDGSPAIAGTNWDGHFHGLDTTHPAVRDHLATLLRTVVQQWGWTYLKLDFLYAGALHGIRHQDLDGENAYRSGIDLVRDVVGDQVHLNASGAPIMASLGIFDSLRVSPDIRPIWDDYATRGTRHAVSTTLARLWLRHGITPDPDVAYFRSRGNLLTPDQRRLMADLGHLTSFRSTSDPPAWLQPDEADALRDFLTQRPRIARTGQYRFDIAGRTADFSSHTFDHPKDDLTRPAARRDLPSPGRPLHVGSRQVGQPPSE